MEEQIFDFIKKKTFHYESPQFVNMMTRMKTELEKTSQTLFIFNDYSNVASVKNANYFIKNYETFVFILDNIATLSLLEFSYFLSCFKWSDENYIFFFCDFVLMRHAFDDAIKMNFTNEQSKLIL